MILRALLSCLLALVLAGTSIEMAVARGAAPAHENVILCSGLERVTLTLNTEGEPVRRSQLCPDAGDALLFVADAPPILSLRAANLRAHVDAVASRQSAGRAILGPHARAPPFLS